MTQINAEQNFQPTPTWKIYLTLMLPSPACQTAALYFNQGRRETGDTILESL
jgi:hypothetical protein